ncbi:MAG: FAD-binding oxidoreductase [Kiritimatiellia bacterium]
MPGIQTDIGPDYLRDESRKTGRADSISFPQTETDIVETVRWVREKGLSITTQGARTGLTGGAVPDGGHILNLSRMKDISGRESLIVQPGATLDEIRAYLKKAAGHLFFAPDPTETTATVGGMAACNASGARSFRYGATRESILAMRVVLGDGDVLALRRGRCMAKGRHFKLKTESGRVIEGELPGYTTPAIKTASGYFVRDHMDLMDLFIGSEGTLGIISELELKLLPWPAAAWGVMAFFDSEEKALAFVRVVRAMEDKPACIEFFDSCSLNLLRQNRQDGAPDIPLEYNTAIYIEYHAASEDGASAMVEHMCRLLEQCGGSEENTWMATDEHERERIRLFRHALPEAVNKLIDERRKSDPQITKLGTDMAVPDDRLDEVMALYHQSLRRLGLEYVIFGHIGSNHVHVNILPRSAAEYEQGRMQYLEWASAVVKMGGTVSAEHGIGKIKAPFLQLMMGEQGIAEMRRIRKVFEPECRLNTGNLFSC